MRAFTLALVVFVAVTTTASAEEEAQLSSLLGKRAAMMSQRSTEKHMSRAIQGKNVVTDTFEDVGDAFSDAGGAIANTAGGVINDIGDFGNAVAGGLEDLGSATLNTLETAKDVTISEFSNGVNALEQHAEAVGTWTSSAAQDVSQWSTEAAGDIVEWAEDAAEDAKDAIEDAAEAIKEVAEDVYNFIKSVFDMLGCAPSQERLFEMINQIAFPSSASATIADVVALFTEGAGPLGSQDGTVASKACQTVWGALELAFPMANTMSVLVAGLKETCNLDLNPALTFGFTVGANVVADVRAAMGGVEVGVGIDGKGNQMCYVGACVSAGIGLPPGPSAGLGAGGVVTFWPTGPSNVPGKSEIAHIGVGLSILAEANATTSRRKATSRIDARSGLKVHATHLEERTAEATETHTGRRLSDLIKAEKKKRDFQSGIDVGASFTAVFAEDKLMTEAPIGYALGFNIGTSVSAGPEQTVPVSPTAEAGFGTCVTVCVTTRKVSSNNSFDCGDIDNGNDNYPSGSTSWSAPEDWMEVVNPHSHRPHGHRPHRHSWGHRHRPGF